MNLPPLLLLNPFDARAGSQRVARVIVDTLDRQGVNMKVRLGFGGEGFLSDCSRVKPDIRCAHIPTRKLLYPLWALAAMVPTAAAALRGRIVWANTIYAVLPALLSAMLSPRRTVIHLHEATYSKIFHWLLVFAARRGATVVCVSSDQANRLGLPATILANPVRIGPSDPPSRRDRLLFVGTTQPIKGFALFVAVCQQLGEFPLQKIAYLSDEARHDPVLIATAKTAGVNIVFGEQSVDTMYQDGFLLLMCTDPRLAAETFSLVSAEAMAALVPVGGTGIAVLPEVLGEALAFNLPSRNPGQIVDAIIRLYADRRRYDDLVAACAVRRSLFSEQAFADRLVALLRNIQQAS